MLRSAQLRSARPEALQAADQERNCQLEQLTHTCHELAEARQGGPAVCGLFGGPVMAGAFQSPDTIWDWDSLSGAAYMDSVMEPFGYQLTRWT